MTVEEIFNKIGNHMLEGLMYHEQFVKAYDFLALYGYSKCQEYHYIEETHSYQKLSHYYFTHYFKILQVDAIPLPEVIPNIWYKYSSQAVDNTTKKNAIKDLMNKWQNWEQETKKLYSSLYNELIILGEVSAAIHISKYLCKVDKELHQIQKQIIYLENINYNLEIIMPEQSTLRNKYKKAIKKI